MHTGWRAAVIILVPFLFPHRVLHMTCPILIIMVFVVMVYHRHKHANERTSDMFQLIHNPYFSFQNRIRKFLHIRIPTNCVFIEVLASKTLQEACVSAQSKQHCL